MFDKYFAKELTSKKSFKARQMGHYVMVSLLVWILINQH